MVSGGCLILRGSRCFILLHICKYISKYITQKLRNWPVSSPRHKCPQVPGMRWQGGLRCFRHLVSMDSIVARHPRHLEMFCPGLDDPRDIWEVNFLYKHTYVLAFQKLLLDVLKHSKASWLDDFIWHCQLIHFFLLESHSTFWDQRPSDTGLRSGHRRFFIASSTSKCQ